MKTIGFGIIGIGRQGLRLAEHIRKDIDHAKLVAVCRRSMEGHDYSRQHNIRFYSNHHDLLADKEVDAVIITTPSNLHGLHAIDCLKAGKHLLIDKPIASTVKEGRKIMALAKEYDLTVAVNFPLRINPVTEVLLNNLPNVGKLKKIQIIASHGPPRSEWQSNPELSNGGVILDIGCHYFDLISFITGSLPKKINSAFSEEAENENSGFIELEHTNFVASLSLVRNQKLKKGLITCAGDKGLIFADYSMREVIISNSHEIKETKCPPTHDFETILNNLVNAINKKEPVIANVQAGINSLRTALLIYRSLKTS